MKQYKTMTSKGIYIKSFAVLLHRYLSQWAKASLTTGTSVACFGKDALMRVIPVQCIQVIYPAALL